MMVLKEAKEMGFRHAALTGGEPILHPKFDKLIDLICSYGMTWSIVTNGSVFERYEPSIEKHGKECKFFSVSLDGMEENHDHIRTQGSFSKVMQAIDFFKAKGLYLKLAFTLNAMNYEELPEIVNLGVQKKVNEVRVAAIIPNNFNWQLKISAEQKAKAYRYITDNKGKLPIKLSFTTSMYTVSEVDKFCSNLNDPEPAINPFGEYVLCCDTNGKGAVIGSLRNETFSSLFIKQLKKAAKLKAQRRQMINDQIFFDDFNSCHFCNKMLDM
jgi:MoaA/NifB/PqqE/SkfB family radical SAM enzyme